MGCWNQTCMLSRLPIRAGDDVVCYVLAQNHNREKMGGGSVYSTDLWSPVMVPIYGKYDDYGRVEDFEKGRFDWYLLEWFNKGLSGGGVTFSKKLRILPDRCAEDKENVPLPKDVHDLLCILQDGRIEMCDWNHEWYDYGYVMMHRHIHDTLIEKYGARVPYQQEKDFKSLLLASTAKLLSTLTSPLPAPGKDASEDEKTAYFHHMFVVGNAKRDKLFGMESRAANSDLFEYLLQLMSPEDLTDMLVQWKLLEGVVSSMRVMWIPQCGQGSQSMEYALHLAMHEACKEVIKTERSRWDDEDPDDMEDVEKWGSETIFWFDRSE